MQTRFSGRSPLVRLGLALCLGLISLVGLWASLTLFTLPPTACAQGTIIYVDRNALGPHDGSSWARAYTDLQVALTAAISGTEIWVADGVYYPGSAGVLTATFQLTDGVALYGGFGGYGISETQRIERNWQLYITVLSGDLDRNDLTDAYGVVTDTANITGTNAYHVVTGSGTDATAVLDGFVVTAGYASADDDESVYKHGSGMYNSSGSSTLANLTFSGNQAKGNGGGIYNIHSNPILTNVTFIGNRAYNGGGMYNGWSEPVLTEAVFRSNHAECAGGGMDSTWDSASTLLHVIFDGNQAADIGGGMYAWGSSDVLTHVAFDGNQANGGGGMYDESGSTLDTVIFRGNQANGGGGMYIKGSPSLTNVIFHSNQSETRGGGMEVQGGAPKLTNVIFSGNRAKSDGGGMSNWPRWYYDTPSTPELTNVTFSGNQADYGGAMFNSKSNPTLVNCILWGDSASTGPEIFNQRSSTLTVTYSNIQWAGGIYTGTGNVNVDPQFVMPITASAAPTTAGDYRLLADSPAIDAGNNLSVTVATDLDGNPRRVDVPWIADTGNGTAPLVDMGAYEYQVGCCIYLPIVLKNYP